MGERVLVFEQHPTIDVSILRKAKLFQSYTNKAVTLKHHMPYQVTWLREQGRLKIEFLIGGKYFCQLVSVSAAGAKFGARFFFECPITRRRCSILHLVGTQFVSRAATRGLSVRAGSPAQREQERLARARNRLLGKDGKGPARGRNRAALIKTLQTKSWGHETWSSEVADEAVQLHDQIERMARRNPSKVKTGPMSTRAGLCGSYETNFAILTEGLDAVTTAQPGSGWQRPKDVQRVEETAAIDLSTLTKAMMISWGQVGSYCLLWDQHCPSIQIVVTVDLRPEHNPGMHIQNLMGSKIPRCGQTVQIVRSANGRMRFICPVTRRPADTVFLRAGLVASRQALHLDYASQVRGRNATRRKNASIKRNLENQKRLYEILHKYEMDTARKRTATPEQRQETQMIIRVAQRRLEKALAGDTRSMISILREHGWGRPQIKIPEVMQGVEREEFLASLAEASPNAPS
jgi:hypothetical protein